MEHLTPCTVEFGPPPNPSESYPVCKDKREHEDDYENLMYPSLSLCSDGGASVESGVEVIIAFVCCIIVFIHLLCQKPHS